jgi:hypothetical protein
MDIKAMMLKHHAAVLWSSRLRMCRKGPASGPFLYDLDLLIMLGGLLLGLPG